MHPSRQSLPPVLQAAILSLLWTAQALPADPPAKVDYQKQIAPLVKKYCHGCHGPKKQEGEMALHKYATEASVLKDQKTWERVLEMLKVRGMPPEDKPQPTDAERILLVEWLDKTLFHYDCEKADDPGRVTIRRLNRAEYNNTIRDLLGLDTDPAKDFPSDDVGEGFDNIGDVLSLPPLLLEKYMDAAERIAGAAIHVPDPARTPRQRKEQDKLAVEEGEVCLARQRHLQLFLQRFGERRVRFPPRRRVSYPRACRRPAGRR